MSSLNVYNYHEELYMKPISYDVSISADDKVIRVEEDGSLLAELSFALSEGHILSMIGKDNMELAQVDFGNFVKGIDGLSYNSEEKAIELTIIQADGTPSTYSIDVAELVNIYTAGNGIDIDNNVISIKLKDEDGPLTIDEEGLDINLDPFIEDIDELSDKIDDLVGQDGKFDETIAEMKSSIEALEDEVVLLDSAISKEIEERTSADADIYSKIGELGEGSATIADEIESLKEQDSSILEMIGNLSGETGDVAETIADAIKRLDETDSDIYSKIGELGEGSATIADEIESLKATDEEIKNIIGDFSDETGSLKETIASEIESLRNDLDSEISERKVKDDEFINLLSIETSNRSEADEAIRGEFASADSALAESIQVVQDEKNNLLYYLMVNGVKHGSINIPADKMLEKVEYDEDNKTLTFIWNTSSQQEPTIIDVSDLIDTYVGGDGIVITHNDSGVKVVSIALSDSKYIKLNEKGQIDAAFSLVKPDGTSWKYFINDKSGSNNGNIIDFSGDYEALKSNISEVYAPISYVDEQDDIVKSELIGNVGDSAEINTLYGIRSAIAKSEEVETAKIAQAKNEAINESSTIADEKDAKVKEDVIAYVDGEIEGVNETIEKNLEETNVKISDVSDVVSKLSSDLIQLSTGLGSEQYEGGEGLFDELHKLFHDLIEGLDENNLNGIVKDIMDRVAVLEKTVNLLIGDASVVGSISNMIKSALEEAKAYTDAAKEEAISTSETNCNEKYNLIVENYVSNETLESYKYIDEKELEDKKYVSTDTFNATLNVYLTKEDAAKSYQPIGTYLSEIPSEYVTELELENKGYATVTYVQDKTDKLLTKEYADSLYQEKSDRYVSESDLNNRGFATELYVNDRTKDMLTKSEAELKYQLKGNYLTEIPSEYVTETELENKGFVTLSYLNGLKYVNETQLQLATEDMLKKTVADATYQPVGDYVTKLELSEKRYVNEADLHEATADMATQTWVMIHFTEKNDGFITEDELAARDYVSNKELEAKNYVDLTNLNTTLEAYETKDNASKVYATKAELDNLSATMVTPGNIFAGDGIEIGTTDNNVLISVSLNKELEIEDTYNQGLPQKGDNLTETIEKLSNAVKDLHDTVDGELF